MCRQIFPWEDIFCIFFLLAKWGIFKAFTWNKSNTFYLKKETPVFISVTRPISEKASSSVCVSLELTAMPIWLEMENSPHFRLTAGVKLTICWPAHWPAYWGQVAFTSRNLVAKCSQWPICLPDAPHLVEPGCNLLNTRQGLPSFSIFFYNLNSWWAGLCTSVLCLWFVAAEHLGQSCSVLDNISDEILDWSWAISLNNVNSLLYQNSLWSCLFKRVTDNTNNSCLRFTTRNLVLKNLLSGSLSYTHQKKVSRSLITREGAYIFRLNSINHIS